MSTSAGAFLRATVPAERDRHDLDVIALTLAGCTDPAIAIAASRAGATGILDLQYFLSEAAASHAMARLACHARGRHGIKVDSASGPFVTDLLAHTPPSISVAIVVPTGEAATGAAVEALRKRNVTVLLETISLEEARLGERLAVDGLIAKGNESGGRVGDESTFILLQRLISQLSLPIWAQGGIGEYTAAACKAAGAAGVVLDAQLALARESPLTETAQSVISRLDGSETKVVGAGSGSAYRLYKPPTSTVLGHLNASPAQDGWRTEIASKIGWDDPDQQIWLLGQDVAFAAPFASRYVTVGGIVQAVRESAARHLQVASELLPLGEGAPLAAAHGTRFPIVQGPMTRVSDVADFAAEVAEGGALPFLALALMRERELETLLQDARSRLAGRPWGVGILGFVPQELRDEQLEVIKRHQPPFGLIAGGRPDQARSLERVGIPTYLHVPSPGLLQMFLADGARRFVFEGRECGGHVGPRSSFVLWETMIDVLLHSLPAAELAECHLLFAGGIHDALSSAMVGAAAGPLAKKGARIGVLLGTAYLFTTEAVSTGAIVERFQREAINCSRTALLESGVGHVTRCVDTTYVQRFEQEKRQLSGRGVPSDELRDTLEELNIGRLRIASKGLTRDATKGLVPLGGEEQYAEGLYMIGQAATLRASRLTISELHHEVSVEGSELLRRARHVDDPAPARSRARIAIVGMACLMPKAPDVRRFWENILNKVDAVGEIPPDRWDWRRYFDADQDAPDKIYSKFGGFLDDVVFDPAEFGMPPNSLASIEPLQLLTLLVVRAALEDAGYSRRQLPRQRTAVILGAGGGVAELGSMYAVRSALPRLLDEVPPEVLAKLPEWSEDSFAGILLNVAAGRVANRFDFGGVNYTVDAACASSLAAVQLASRELEAGTADVVITGGVDTVQSPFGYLCFSKTHALSPTGRCKTFDASADGIAISEGLAVLVLKRLDDAERDGDRIYAIIDAVEGSSDGRDKGLTAPRPEGQALALERAYARAGFSPSTVGLVEAHGTGTVAGDQAEISALRKVFEAGGAMPQSCAIGSVKSVVGHTKCAAGAAGLIKVALALHHKVLPPTANVETPNPKALFPETPFYVNTEARPWLHDAAAHPRRGAVSAFGFGGTNFHAVLEEYTGTFLESGVEATADEWPGELFVWRAASRDSLLAAIEPYRSAATQASDLAVRNLAYTLSRRGAAEGKLALSVVATSAEDLTMKLDEAARLLAEGSAFPQTDPHGIYFSADPLGAEGKVAFLFPGQGSQYPNMLRDLSLHFDEVRGRFELADRVLRDRLPSTLSSYVYPSPAFTDEERQFRQNALTQTNVAQPALGAVDMGLFQVLSKLGVSPDMVAGHSYGEYAALCAAGVFEEEVLYALSEARGRCIIDAVANEPGAMAAVVESEARVTECLRGLADVWVANINAPRQTIISGSTAGIAQAVERLTANAIEARPIAVACAFHSPLLKDAGDRLSTVIAGIPFGAAHLPVFSNASAAEYPEDPSAIRDMLRQHLVSPVRFATEIEAMYKAGARIFVEVGPRSALTGMVDQVLDQLPHLAVAPDGGRGGRLQLLLTLGRLAANGIPVDSARLFRGRAVREFDWEDVAAGKQPRTLSPTAWLVNGAKARPAHQPITRPMLPDGTHRATQAAQPLPVTSPAVAAAGAPARFVASGDTDSVLIEFQHLMGRFLETQERVMRAYLDGPADTSRGLPDFAMPELEAPAVAQSQTEELRSVQKVADSNAGSASDPIGGPTAIATALLRIVSDRTGYPVEMLDLDLDIEADLGIDSIKRLEVLGTFQRLHIPRDRQIPADVTESLSRLKTLRAIVERIAAILGDEPAPAVTTVNPIGANGHSRLNGDANGHGVDLVPSPKIAAGIAPARESDVPRFVLVPVGRPLSGDQIALAPGVYVITDDESGTAQHLRDGLLARGAEAVVIKAVGEQAQSIRQRGPIAGLIHLAPRTVPADDPISWQDAIRRDVRSLFLLLKALGPDLKRAGGRLVAATTGSESSPDQAAVAGLVKTCAAEWPGVRCRVVDFERAASPSDRAMILLAELTAADVEVEVSYKDSRRTALEPVPSADKPDPATLGIDSEWVFLVTGGARGITARIALELARLWHPTLVLVGRSAPPEVESAATRAVSSPRELKAALMDAMRKRGSAVTPASVEAVYTRLLQDREIRANIAALEQAGARVEYMQADVREADRVCQVVENVYAQFGRLDAVIHGAGVIEDRLIDDKDLDSFDRVFDTKVAGALALAQAVKPDVKLMVFFSSVSARFGNAGQADYAAANEALNKIAARLDGQLEGRIESIMWGPWQSGMVSQEVQAKFDRSGVQVIAPDAGAHAFVRELGLLAKTRTEVILGNGPWRSSPRRAPYVHTIDLPAGVAPADASEARAMVLLDPTIYGYLADHKLDGNPVLPAAVAMELMVELAQRRWPMLVAGIHDFCVLKGVVLEGGRPRQVQIDARAEFDVNRPPDIAFINAGIVDVATGAACYRARLELRQGLGGSPTIAPQPLREAQPYPMTVEAAYEQLLFHGPSLRGIARIDGMSEAGIDATLQPSIPRASVAAANGASWVLDPVTIDSAFQLAILWARVHLDSTPLPTGFRSFTRWAPLPSTLVQCEFRVRATVDGQALDARYVFRDAGGGLLAELEGVEFICNPSLNRLASAFARAT